MEQARLLKEYLPVIRDPAQDVVTRGYLLRSAVRTNSLDADAAFEIAQDYLRSGLPEHHYKRIMATTLPGSIGAFARRGVQIAIEWHGAYSRFPNLDTMFDPVSGVEHLPDDAPFISEGRILRDILYDNLWRFDGCSCPELSHDEEIPEHLYGLFVLLQTRDPEIAEALSHRPEEGFRIIGMVMRVWHNGVGDQEATRFLEDEFHSVVLSDARLRRASALFPLMRWISNEEKGFGASTLTGMLASIAVGELPRDGVVGYSGFQWTAGEILLSAPAESVRREASKIISFLEKFRDAIAGADRDELRAIANEGTGRIVRLLVRVIHDAEIQKASRVLKSIRGINEDTLRYFPFLKEDVERAYKKLK